MDDTNIALIGFGVAVALVLLLFVYGPKVIAWWLGYMGRKVEPVFAAHQQQAAAEERARFEREMRLCPFCAEPIKRAAVACRYCGRDVPQHPVPSATDGRS